MSFGPDFAKMSSPEVTSKKRKGAAGSSQATQHENSDLVDLLVEAVAVMGREIVTTSSNVRTLKAAVMHTALVPTSSNIADTMLKAQQQYADKCRGQKGHTLGLPEHWSFAAALHVVLSELTDEACKKECRDLLELYARDGLKVFKKKIYVCRAVKCRDQARTRLEFKLCHQWSNFEGIILEYLGRLSDAEVCDGRGPRGPAERALPAILDNIKKLHG